MAAMVSGRRSFGCGLVKLIRRMPSTAPAARSRSANSGRARRPPSATQACPVSWTVRVAVSPLPGGCPGDPLAGRMSGTATPPPHRQVPAVGVDVLSEQGDLDRPTLGEGPHLGHEIAERPAHLRAADRRHDAEGARVVAADLDRDPSRMGQVRRGPPSPPGTPGVLARRERRGSRRRDDSAAGVPRRAAPRPGRRCGCRRPRRRGGPARGRARGPSGRGNPQRRSAGLGAWTASDFR